MTRILLSVGVMIVVTYLPRAIPFLFSRPITSKFILSFLSYIPYAVLAVMTIPAIFSSTGEPLSAVVGCGVAAVLSWFGCKLALVAVAAVAAAFLCLYLQQALAISCISMI